jgi:hypothetical protein
MFKQVPNGSRRASGGRTVARVSSASLNRVAAAPVPTRGAWVPETMQEQGQDSPSSSRLQGLEKLYR